MTKQRRIGDQFHVGSRDFSSTFRARLWPTQPLIRSLHCPDVWGPPSLPSGPFIVQTSRAHPASYPVPSLSRRLGPTQPLIRSFHCPDVWGLLSLPSSPFIVQTSRAQPASYPVPSLSRRLGRTQPPIRSLHCPDVWGLPSLVSSCYRGLMPV